MNKHTRVWSLQDAKAKFSEVVRLAQSEGPQIVTVHGKEAVTITKSVQPIDMTGKTGSDLLRAFQACPYPEFFDELEKLRLQEAVVLKNTEFE